MKKTRIGFIGTGNIANVHIAGYKAIADKVELVAVCDLDQQKSENFARNNGFERSYTDFNEMLEKEQLDAVSVCTWNASHKDATITCLNKGINVICEKPMAMNTQEGLEMKAAAEKSGKLLMIGFVRRFGNDADIIKKFISGGDLGDIYYAKASYIRRNGCPGGWFGDKAYSGGGPLIDLGVHVIDFVRYLAGSPNPVSVYGVTYNNLGMNRAGGGQSWVSSTNNMTFKYDVEDFVSAMIRFDNGLTLAIEASFNLNVKKDSGNIELFGTKAGVKVDPQVEIFSDMNGMFVDIKPFGDSGLSFNGLFDREIAHFIDCVQNGTDCISKAEDGVALMKIIDAIYQSASTGNEVKIK